MKFREFVHVQRALDSVGASSFVCLETNTLRCTLDYQNSRPSQQTVDFKELFSIPYWGEPKFVTIWNGKHQVILFLDPSFTVDIKPRIVDPQDGYVYELRPAFVPSAMIPERIRRWLKIIGVKLRESGVVEVLVRSRVLDHFDEYGNPVWKTREEREVSCAPVASSEPGPPKWVPEND